MTLDGPVKHLVLSVPEGEKIEIDMGLLTIIILPRMDFAPINFGKIKGESDTYFIHFDTPEKCQAFMEKYTQSIGHICCSGKGCHLPNVKSWKEIHRLRNESS